MPDVTHENFSHLLNSQQNETAKAAVAAGRSYDVRSEALTNLVRKFEDDPRQALTYLSEVANPLQKRGQELEDIRARDPSHNLGADQKQELDRINEQLAGTASISGDVVREITQAKAQRLEEYRAQGTQSLEGLRGTVQALGVTYESAKQQLKDAKTRFSTDPDKAEKLRPFEDNARMAEARHKEAEGVYNDMNRTAAERNAREAARTGKEQTVGRERQLRGMSLDELGGTAGELKDDRDRKQKELDGATARFNETNDVLSRKKVETAGEEKVDHSAYDAHDILGKLLNGGPVTKEELAFYGDYIANRFIEHRREGVDMGELHRIFSSRPKLQKYFVDKISKSDQLRDFMRERFPTNWEKTLDFARNHPGWLMILLVETAGAAGAVAGPAAGVALGAGGAGGGAFGVSRRNW